MPRSSVKPSIPAENYSAVGVGLRHAHYQDALVEASPIDFVEIHAENFFAEGGVIPEILEDIVSQFDVSLHSTSMGLGSASGINQNYLTRLKELSDRINPRLVSDHACYTWATINSSTVHAGDLLPIELTQAGLDVLTENVDRVQQFMGRKILVENISSYLHFDKSTMTETEFLARLAEKTQCGLLVDLNNIMVNAHNFSDQPALLYATQWLQEIPTHYIGEFHLAGSTPVSAADMLIDDHAMPVSDECWALYEFAVEQVKGVPALIEWDNHLPSWQTLLKQAEIAQSINQNVAKAGGEKCYLIQ